MGGVTRSEASAPTQCFIDKLIKGHFCFSMFNDIPCIDDSRASIQCILFDTVEIESTQKSVTSIAQSRFRGHPLPPGGRINAHLSL